MASRRVASRHVTLSLDVVIYNVEQVEKTDKMRSIFDGYIFYINRNNVLFGQLMKNVFLPSGFIKNVFLDVDEIVYCSFPEVILFHR